MTTQPRLHEFWVSVRELVLNKVDGCYGIETSTDVLGLPREVGQEGGSKNRVLATEAVWKLA